LSERVSFVMPKQLKSLKELQDLTGEDQSTVLRKVVDRGLGEAKMDIAVDRYVKEMMSLEQATVIAGVSLWRFLDELRRRNVVLKYSAADVEAEINKVLGRKRHPCRSFAEGSAASILDATAARRESTIGLAHDQVKPLGPATSVDMSA